MFVELMFSFEGMGAWVVVVGATVEGSMAGGAAVAGAVAGGCSSQLLDTKAGEVGDAGAVSREFSSLSELESGIVETDSRRRGLSWRLGKETFPTRVRSLLGQSSFVLAGGSETAELLDALSLLLLFGGTEPPEVGGVGSGCDFACGWD